jgi:hypothetical protein
MLLIQILLTFTTFREAVLIHNETSMDNIANRIFSGFTDSQPSRLKHKFRATGISQIFLIPVYSFGPNTLKHPNRIYENAPEKVCLLSYVHRKHIRSSVTKSTPYMMERGYIGNKLHHISDISRLMTSLTTPILSHITPVFR